MHNVLSIGSQPWTRTEIIDQLDEFLTIYRDRPIEDNQGGMKAPHMFAVWFMVRHLSPDLIVESGIWRGQSTWLLESACPSAKLVSIDINLENRLYVSDRVMYSDKDFVEQDWSNVSDRSLVFFDDHQNAYKRMMQCKWFGFKHVIFEDNYPITQGDCYSLKKAFANAGFEPSYSQVKIPSNNILSKIRNGLARIVGVAPISLTPQYDSVKVFPNEIDSKNVEKKS